MSESFDSPARRTREHYVLVALALAVVPLLAAIGFLLEPDGRGHGTHEQLGLPACWSPAALGIPCPGCGVTTAVVHGLHGHPVRAFVTQPLGFLLLLGAPLAAFWILRTHVRGRDAWVTAVSGRGDRWVRGTCLVVAIAWVWKILAAGGAAG